MHCQYYDGPDGCTRERMSLLIAVDNAVSITAIECLGHLTSG